MAANPITYDEIGAYDRETFAGLSVWAKKLIRRIDDAVLRVVAEEREKEAPAKSEVGGNQIPVTNTKGIRAMLRGLAAKKDPE
jgi:hypothetical protein